ncbi:MAG: dienelactone hydrolase family protein [Flavobacteriales bacterium]
MKTMKSLFALCALIVASLTVSAEIKTESVTYSLDGVEFHGYVSYDATHEGAMPLVLVVHEWWGCNIFAKEKAEEIASLGYFAFAVDLYGDYKLADNPQAAMALSGVLYNDSQLALNRLNAAVKKASEYAMCDTKNVSAIGFCFGGSMVLNAAKLGMDLKAVVSFHGGLAGVPAVKGKCTANILVCHGGSDPFVPQNDVDAFKKDCDNAKINYDFKVYKDATHAFTNPYSTEVGKRFGLPIAYNEQAAKDSWNDMKAFFEKYINK